MKHKDKVKLARKLITREEIKNRVSIWDSKAWEVRKQARHEKAKQLNLTRHSWALARKAERKGG